MRSSGQLRTLATSNNGINGYFLTQTSTNVYHKFPQPREVFLSGEVGIILFARLNDGLWGVESFVPGDLQVLRVPINTRRLRYAECIHNAICCL